MGRSRGSSVSASFPIRGWFADSHPHFRRDLVALARPKSFAAGSVIFQAGETGQDVFGIVSGLLEQGRRVTAVARHVPRTCSPERTSP